ncbi:energy-coupling factor ABC transporter permease [Desulfosporosinus sp. Sb-LF]|uniref:energy-coupling factor ABC transporter permease n=1 Tax=Desulfosporosinus sp. Sb-LF TaxID=2560027 RepID=UPI00107F34FB|nr:energy-coupling factor ABC transporter permease [Desulfosporosinus sp. Sb-LF]TGE33241.1 energy-coupling factor ABC transporter permease [Desulfosporosinus sp. Sb-LF]
MHIAEGMLPAPYAIAYWVGASAFVAAGARSLAKKSRELPMMKQLTGVMTAGIFLVSLLPIPVPMTGTCSHPGGTPLGAILLGPAIATLMSLIALLFQALFFSHGGLTTLGANTLTMGVFGGWVGWGLFWGLRRIRLNLFWSGFVAGLIGDIAIYVGTSTQLALAIHGTHPFSEVFLAIFTVFIPTQWPLAILEGIFTGLVLKYIAEHRPDILMLLHVLPASDNYQRANSETAASSVLSERGEKE